MPESIIIPCGASVSAYLVAWPDSEPDATPELVLVLIQEPRYLHDGYISR